MKRSNSLLILCILLTLSLTSFSQITIGPEIGISVFPFKIYARESYKTNNISLSYGVFGMLPVAKKIITKVSVSYSDRKDFCLKNGNIISDYNKTYYSSSDLNLDLSVSYKWSERIFSGIGFSSVYKLNAWAGQGPTCDPDSMFTIGDMSHMQYALNASIEYHWKHVIASFLYARFLRVEYLGNFGLSGKIGLNRYDLRVAYPIRFKSRNAGK